MGSAGLQNPVRQLPGGNLSFAQSVSGSTPATQLDLSYVSLPSFFLRDSYFTGPSPLLFTHLKHLASSGGSFSLWKTRSPFHSNQSW